MKTYPLKNLVIAGGGHASLPLIKMGHIWREKNLSITLISAEPYLVYSGALPQYMGGFYEWHQTAIDLEELCDRYGVHFSQDRVTSVDHHNKIISTENGSSTPFDLLVINVGASTRNQPNIENGYPVKPMSELLSLKKKIISGRVKNILIKGGGAAGTEIALNLSHPKNQNNCKITITELNSRLLSGFPLQASERATKILSSRGVDILTGEKYISIDSSAFDAVIYATGNNPESVNIAHSLPTNSSNRIVTDRTLLVKDTQSIFAAGDTADVDGLKLPQIGVHAVKQGVTLRHNINALLAGKPLKPYKPYPLNPLIISNGSDDAMFIAKKTVFSGKSSAVLKYLLDMRWLEKYTLVSANRRSLYRLLTDGIKRS